jgi:UDP-glucose 4-epimerase
LYNIIIELKFTQKDINKLEQIQDEYYKKILNTNLNVIVQFTILKYILKTKLLTFYKCWRNGYCLNNSNIKIPKNIVKVILKKNIKILYIIIIMFQNKKILLFGGSGSLGNKFIEKHISNNQITNYSRDECKHWSMSLKYKTDNLKFIIGDIRDYQNVASAILREQPHIIIIMAALKHIDRCEYAIDECIKTNSIGPINVVNAVEKNNDRLKNLEVVVMVSTDKACEPTNVYGMAKALAESAIVEKSLYVSNRKFVNIRYGNVLNSRGSIIPILHEKGNDPDVKDFTLTHKDMTRFVMTLEQSVELIEYAAEFGESGDTVIPKLISLKLFDLMQIFSEKYNKPVKVTGLRPGEKMLESLISETQAMRLIKKDNGYMHIKPPYQNLLVLDDVHNYNSKINPLTKEELFEYLNRLGLL